MEGKRIHRVWIRLSDEEYQLFKKKAGSHNTTLDMIRNAVLQYNDVLTSQKLRIMNDMAAFFKEFEDHLAHLGGNLNQAMHRANELSATGHLDESYFRNILLPQIGQTRKSLDEMKAALRGATRKVISI